VTDMARPCLGNHHYRPSGLDELTKGEEQSGCEKRM
jgi:hypothetical protein